MKYVGIRLHGRTRLLVGAVAATLCAGGSAAGLNDSHLLVAAARAAAASAPAALERSPKFAAAVTKPGELARYTVLLREPALASYQGQDSRFAAAPRNAKGRLDVRSAAAVSYVNHLRATQQEFVSSAGTQIGRPLDALMTFQHAVNGVVVEMTAAEAALLAARSDVLLVEREEMRPLLTDRGPSFIGADKIWDGTATGGVMSQGEGVVIGDIDSGINFTSPSFAGLGPKDGYQHINPLGAGNYLGLCQTGGADEGHCNDKLIGLFDFVNSVCIGAGNPCGAAGTWVDEPSATDSNGHGSHTASTAAGNHADVTLSGGNFTISGVAPHATLVAYDACYTRVSDGGGLCPTSSTTAAANQAVADGIVDIITFSIGGGTSPWTDSTSQAFLGAQNAGIFVVAAAGNDGPAASTVSHVEPWVATAAASTHDRVLGYTFSLEAPGNPPPVGTVDLAVRPGGNPQPTGDLVNLPIKESPGFANGNNDGCSAFADPHTFDRDVTADEEIFTDGFEGTSPPALIQKGIAVLHLDGNNSGCGSVTRRGNALAAGAAGVIFVDTTYLNLGASDTSYAMTMAQWNAVKAQIDTDPTHAKASVVLPLKSFLSGQGDVVADFSSRGPAAGIGGQAIVKPEISAPGVAILAAYMGDPGSVAIEDGTSMSTPHIAGSAALLRSLHPTWSPLQIRSAMMLTAKTAGVVKQDNTPAGVWERGSGRVDLVAAAKVGLIFDESGANYAAANPSLGGKISTLNLPSIAESSCVGTCTFQRTVRSARTGGVTYTLAVSGFAAGVASVAPTSFTISTTGTKSFTVSVDGTQLTAGQYTFGELTLTPSDPSVPVQHLPIAIKPGGPAIQLSASSVTSSQAAGTQVGKTITVTNVGNPTLNWSVATTSVASNLLNTASAGSGYPGGYYTPISDGIYEGQNFDVVGNVHITNLRASGFVLPSGNLSTTNTTAVTFSIYGDAPGLPNGAPEGVGQPPIWTYTAAANGPGISIASNGLTLDLTNGAVPALNLTTGRYWLVAFPTMNTSGSPGWYWRVSPDSGVGNKPAIIEPVADPTWATITNYNAMAARVQGTIDCTQPAWVSYVPTSGALGYNAHDDVTVTFDSTGLAPGTYSGTLCVSSNDTAKPVAVAGVTLTVTP